MGSEKPDDSPSVAGQWRKDFHIAPIAAPDSNERWSDLWLLKKANATLTAAQIREKSYSQASSSLHGKVKVDHDLAKWKDCQDA
jgi:hypothetical protein